MNRIDSFFRVVPSLPTDENFKAILKRMDTLKSNDVVSSFIFHDKSRCQVKKSDLCTLKPGIWLNDSVIANCLFLS